MNVITRTLAAVCSAACLSLALAGCGGSLEGGGAAALRGTVSGASAGTTVSVRDASAQTRTATTDAAGRFTVDVKGLAAPYVIRAEWSQPEGAQRLYGVARGSHATSVNRFSDTLAKGACRGRGGGGGGEDDDDVWNQPIGVEDLEDFLEELATILQPLFERYGLPASGDDLEDSPAVEAMLEDVSFEATSGTLTVTNRATGGVIFTGPIDDLASGTFYPENLPGGSGTPTPPPPPPPPPPSACTYTYSAWGACQANGTQTRTVLSATPAGCNGTPVLTQACTALDGAALYQLHCAGCHGNSRKGSSASSIQAAIANNAGGVMGSASLRALTAAELAAIAAAP